MQLKFVITVGRHLTSVLGKLAEYIECDIQSLVM
jgi:hypothetical protein